MFISINNRRFEVKTVFLPKDTEKGMMGRFFDKSFQGMLFLMSDEEHCFWMKNCLFNLDIIFISNNKISKIHHNCPVCSSENCPNYCGDGDMILELKAGSCKKYDLQEGDLVTILSK